MKDTLNNIEQLIPILKEFQTKGTANISIDEKLLLKKTYNNIHPHVQVDISCTTCILHYLNQLLAFYEREKPKQILIEHAPEETTPKKNKPMKKKNTNVTRTKRTVQKKNS